MRNPKFKKIVPNYRKKVLEIILKEGKVLQSYILPFSIFRDIRISSKNKFTSLRIDHSLYDQAVTFVLEDGSEGDFPSDLVLYHCDPTYEWSALNQFKRAIAEKLKEAKISVRVLADILKTSPAQVARILQSGECAKQLSQLFHMAELSGYQVQLSLEPLNR